MKLVEIGDLTYIRTYIECDTPGCVRRIFMTLLPEVYYFFVQRELLCPACDPKRISLGLNLDITVP